MAYTKHTYKGKYIPTNPQKYCGDVTKIVYRSSYEVRFMRWCDINSNVLQWGSEEVVIPYRSPMDNLMHRYFVDFFVKVKSKNGVVKKYLVEVKPLRYTQEPVMPKRKTQHFLAEVMQWGINQAKWDAARKFAVTTGCEFLLVTEHDLGLLIIPMEPFHYHHK